MKKKKEITRDIIAKQIEKAKFIYIFCIAGSDFFSFPRGAISGGGKYYAIILKRLEDCKENNNKLDLYIKALLMNPNSKVANFRNEIEEVDISQGNIQEDVNTSLEGISKLNRIFGMEDNVKKPFIDYRLYSVFPQSGFILTDTCVFIEPYHFAPTKDFCKTLKENDLHATDLKNICTGGRVPVFKFHYKSNMYIAMKKHFDTMWKYVEHADQP